MFCADRGLRQSGTVRRLRLLLGERISFSSALMMGAKREALMRKRSFRRHSSNVGSASVIGEGALSSIAGTFWL